MSTTNNQILFNNLTNLPVQLLNAQCVWFNSTELLICGGKYNRKCYSYNTLNGQYKIICTYPKHVASSLIGHAVIPYYVSHRRNDDNDEEGEEKNNEKESRRKRNSDDHWTFQMTLLSFGGQTTDQKKYTLMMKYQSVWSNDLYLNNNFNNESINLDNIEKKLSNIKSKHKNRWISAPFEIGSIKDDMCNIRVLIGGSTNHLLFIIYPPNRISVLSMQHSLKTIATQILPFTFYDGSCFVQVNSCHMILFYMFCGLSIVYDEHKGIFEYQNLSICSDFLQVSDYSCVCLQDFIILFGGRGRVNPDTVLNKVAVYSVKTQKWRICSQQLPTPIYSSFAILSQDNTSIHIIGGRQMYGSKQHLKIRTRTLIGSEKGERTLY